MKLNAMGMTELGNFMTMERVADTGGWQQGHDLGHLVEAGSVASAEPWPVLRPGFCAERALKLGNALSGSLIIRISDGFEYIPAS